MIYVVVIAILIFMMLIRFLNCVSYEPYIDNIPVYVISLKRSTERRKTIEKMLDSGGIEFTYFDAVDGKNMSNDDNYMRNKYVTENTLNPGQIGCFLSHVNLLNRAVDSGKYTLILEDDAKVPNDIIDKIIKIIENSPKDFDIIFLGYNYYEEYNTFKQVNYMHGAHAYIINPKNLTKEKFKKLFPILNPYDVILPIILKTYIIIPKIVELNEKFCGTSNTQSII
jgi:glycosyl transferase family 25